MAASSLRRDDPLRSGVLPPRVLLQQEHAGSVTLQAAVGTIGNNSKKENNDNWFPLHKNQHYFECF